MANLYIFPTLKIFLSPTPPKNFDAGATTAHPAKYEVEVWRPTFNIYEVLHLKFEITWGFPCPAMHCRFKCQQTTSRPTHVCIHPHTKTNNTYLTRILLTHPCETLSCLEISHGLTPCCAMSTICCRMAWGRGLPLANWPPSWFIALSASVCSSEETRQHKIYILKWYLLQMYAL